jgi:hypothetical protein
LSTLPVMKRPVPDWLGGESERRSGVRDVWDWPVSGRSVGVWCDVRLCLAAGSATFRSYS